MPAKKKSPKSKELLTAKERVGAVARMQYLRRIALSPYRSPASRLASMLEAKFIGDLLVSDRKPLPAASPVSKKEG